MAGQGQMEDQKDGRRHAKSLKGRYVGSLEGGHARSPKGGHARLLDKGAGWTSR